MSDSKVLGYVPALDGLRLLCCVAVIAAHSFVSTPLSDIGDNLGRLGVDAFFTLSGFLITKLLLEEARKTGRVDLRAFYIRRTLRIWPVYYLALLGFGLPFILNGRLNSTFGYEPQPGLLTEALPLHLVFLANWASTPLPTPLRVLWSISVEEQFYLIFPGLLVLAQRLFYRPVPWLALSLIAAGAMARVAVAFPAPPLWVLQQTWVVSDFLLMGALGAFLLDSQPELVLRITIAMGRSCEVFFAGALLGLLAFVPFKGNATLVSWTFVLYNPIVSLVFMLLVLYLTVSDRTSGLSRCLSVPAAARLGKITYAAYVFHMYAVAVAWALANQLGARHGIESALTRLALATPLTFALAFASKWLVEDRFARLRHRFLR